MLSCWWTLSQALVSSTNFTLTLDMQENMYYVCYMYGKVDTVGIDSGSL